MLVVIALLLLAAWLLLQTPKVQTFAAKKAVAALEEKIDGRIEFSKVHFKPFNALVLKDVTMLDNNPVTLPDGERLDTIAKAKSITATFSLKGLLKKEGIHIKRVNVSDGSFTLVSDDNGTNIGRFLRSDKEKEDGKKDMGNVFDARKVEVDNFRFRMVNLKDGKPYAGHGIDWKDLDLTVDRLNATGVSLSNGYVKGSVEKLSAREKSGYEIVNLTGKTRVGGGRVTIQDLHLNDGMSRIHMPEYSMTFDDAGSFSHYLEDVRMTGNIKNSKLDSRSLSYFVPALKDKNVVLNIPKADIDGTVSDLTVNRLDFEEAASGVKGSVEGRITGLPDVDGLDMDVTLEDFSFTTEGLDRLVRNVAPGAKVDLGKFAKGERISFDGKCKGKINDLDVDGKVSTPSLGTAETSLKVKDLTDKSRPMNVKGNIVTRKLDIGKLAGIKQVGEVTLRGALDATLGDGNTDIRIDTLVIDKLNALGYDYSNIRAAGTYSDDTFDGRVVCSDPNLNFLFQGIASLPGKGKDEIYKFYANVGYADLEALNIDKRGGTSKVSGEINANYVKDGGSGEVVGDFDISGLNLQNDKGSFDIGKVSVKAHDDGGGRHSIVLDSGFADGTYTGSKPVTDLLGDLKELALRESLPVLLDGKERKWEGGVYKVDLDIHDAKDVLAYAMPGLYIADSTRVRLDVNDEGLLTASVKSPRVAMGKNYLKGLDLKLDNRNGSLNGTAKGSEISAGGMVLKNDNISIHAKDNQIGLGCTYDNQTEAGDKGEIFMSGELGKTASGELALRGKTLPSNICYNGNNWKIGQSSINLIGKDISIGSLVASCGEQSIKVDGGYSSTKSDTLSVDLNKFDMGIANQFLGEGFGISGRASGHATVISPWNGNSGLLLNIRCDSTRIAGKDAGTLRLSSTLDDSGKMHIAANNDIGGKKTLDLLGDYNTKNGSLDLTCNLDGFDAGYAAPVLNSVFSEVSGNMNGKVRVYGKKDDIHLASEGTRFDDLMLKIDYTNVPYYLNGPFHLADDGVHFDNIAIRDRYDGTGTVSGGIKFNHLKDFNLDTRIRVNKIEAIDMKADSGESFYGNLFASGIVRVKGPFNSVQLDIDARTEKNGSLHIPIDNASNAGKYDLLTFKEDKKEVYVDPYDVMMNRIVTESKKKSDFGLKLRVNCTSGTEAYLEIDRNAGNVLNGRGQGNLDIEVRPGSNVFSINGDYTLNTGNFHFNAMDIAKRDFTISEGSSIRFNGDVMDSDLDIEGTYTTKASVATLIADTTAIAARRAVNCTIGISGKIREPQLTFSIDVPDLDPTTKSKVESALNTEDKVQKQFLSLLISGGFLPDEQSGVVNNTNTLYSNVAEIMAGQLNSILQKLDIPLDLGLSYQSSESGTNIFDVAVSTQLFNNRVLVNGNVGNREYGNSTEGDVVGDIDIEIKLDKPGQLRLNLFSHSADDYTNYLDNTQRSGVGIAYQKEFDTLTEFFRDLFSTRKQREERIRQMERPVRDIPDSLRTRRDSTMLPRMQRPDSAGFNLPPVRSGERLMGMPAGWTRERNRIVITKDDLAR